MTRTALAALLLLPLVARPAAAQGSPSFYITHTSAGVRAVGQAMGAGTLIAVRFGDVGGNYSGTIVVTDSRSGRVLSRNSRTMKADDDALDELDAMATQVAQGLGTPDCKPASWTGTVTVTEQFSGSAPTPDGETMSGSRSMSLNCKLDETGGSEATCMVSYRKARSPRYPTRAHARCSSEAGNSRARPGSAEVAPCRGAAGSARSSPPGTCARRRGAEEAAAR